jgi:ribosomal protein S12 methylthiotransferase accessory factor
MKADNRNVIPGNLSIELRDGKIIHTETGSYTVLPPDTIITAEEVFERIGVVSVEQINPKFTDGVPIFRLNEASGKAKCHRQACQWAPPPTPLNNPPKESFGKGMTLEQSKASAMMEAVERYCGQRFPHSRVIKATYEEVRDYAIHPSEFNLPTLPLKCENCVERNRGCFQELQNVCQEWTWGYSLITKAPVLIPSAVVYYPYISESNISFIFNDTGGLSAGNTLEEAILQGIAEVIERDALYYAFNLDNLRSMPMVNFKNTKNRHIRKFITEVLPPERIFAFYIQNKNLELNIASFGAFICYKIGSEHSYFGGSGTSLNPEIALLRALTELEQQKVRQKVFVEFDPGDLLSHNGLRREDAINLEAIPNQSTDDIRKDIELYLDRLLINDTDVIIINLTHPEIGIPVVRVVIPKLISYSGSPIKESVFINMIRAHAPIGS